jgi:hypothetical protein
MSSKNNIPEFLSRRKIWFYHMPAQIVIDGKNGALNIDKSRQATNQDNHTQGLNCWNVIINMDESKFPDYKVIKFPTKGKSEEEKKFWKHVVKQISETIPSRIKKNYIHYGLKDPSEISWKHIKQMAQLYLDAHPWLQINYCIDSSRQGVDEKVQRHMLSKFVGGGDFTKARQGTYVFEGQFWTSKKQLLKHKGLEKLDIKDIDTCGIMGTKKIWIFQKSTKIGGGHQDNVWAECSHVVREFNLYAAQHKDDNYFVAQLDGEFMDAEVIPRAHDLITHKKRVFVGNSEQVITWLSQL